MKALTYTALALCILVAGCGSGSSSIINPQPEPTPVAPEPLTPSPNPEPAPSPSPLFVQGTHFNVLYGSQGPEMTGLTLSLVRDGRVTQQFTTGQDGVTVDSVLPGTFQVRLDGLSILHQYQAQEVTISRDNQSFTLVVTLRPHGSTVVYGDSNTSNGACEVDYDCNHAEFVELLQQDAVYADSVRAPTRILNHALGGEGLLDVWPDRQMSGEERIMRDLERMLESGDPLPAFAVDRHGLIDLRNKPFPDRYNSALQRVVNAWLDAGIVPVLCLIGDQADGQYRGITAQFNAVIREVAEEYGLPLVDYVIPWDPAFYKDDRHHNRAGHQEMAEATADTISTWLTQGQ